MQDLISVFKSPARSSWQRAFSLRLHYAQLVTNCLFRSLNFSLTNPGPLPILLYRQSRLTLSAYWYGPGSRSDQPSMYTFFDKETSQFLPLQYPHLSIPAIRILYIFAFLPHNHYKFNYKIKSPNFIDHWYLKKKKIDH